MIALGSNNGERIAVRSLDRWYCDAVQQLFRVKVYASDYNVDRDGGPQWTIKSARVQMPNVSEVQDWRGFARAWIEIHGSIDQGVHKHRDGSHTRFIRLRIYGPDEILAAIQPHLPAREKIIQTVSTDNGRTCALYYQSRTEIPAIIDYIDGMPRNETIWDMWSNYAIGSGRERG